MPTNQIAQMKSSCQTPGKAQNAKPNLRRYRKSELFYKK